MATEQIERRIWIDAAPPVVYEFFLEPARLMQWEGLEAEVDPRVGGDYRVIISEQDSAHSPSMLRHLTARSSSPTPCSARSVKA